MTGKENRPKLLLMQRLEHADQLDGVGGVSDGETVVILGSLPTVRLERVEFLSVIVAVTVSVILRGLQRIVLVVKHGDVCFRVLRHRRPFGRHNNTLRTVDDYDMLTSLLVGVPVLYIPSRRN